MRALPVRALPLFSALALVTGVVAALVVSAGPADASSMLGTRYAVEKPVCARPSGPDANRCFSVRRVQVPKGTKGAKAFTVRADSTTTGPAGGYTPADLSSGYGFNPNTNRSTTTVAVVLWNDDPTALEDLDKFDAHYNLPPETPTSFRKVDQTGGSELPAPDSDAAIEESLDIQAIRGVCHSCRILLVEANTAADSDLAVAENYAATHASVVNNSWGGGEQNAPSPSLVSAFAGHPGVALVVSSGDSGWYDWDYANYQSPPDDPGLAPNYPSSDTHVIAVSGTTLTLTSSGGRASEAVWNNDGREDVDGATGAGVAGGGCSKRYTAAGWQSHFVGYPSACGGKRLAADISADADPMTGYDIYDSYGAGGTGWQTVGGTSLSAPIISAMVALAGGTGGVTNPGATLYANALHHPSTVYDVTSGGTGFCDGDTPAHCASVSDSELGTTNPNIYVGARVDCNWPNTTSTTAPASANRECNAAKGYDGASGLGTPNGLGVFALAHPAASISAIDSKRIATLSAKLTEPVRGISAVSYSWTFGDGRTSTTAQPKHAYAKAGTYTVRVTVTDSQRLTATANAHVTVGKAPTISFHGATSVKHKHSIAYSAKGSHANNTGAHITEVSWKWGDKHTSTGTSVHHTWAKKGKYTITETITDSAGYTNHTTRHITVK